ncbi:hypothetical protein A7U60_g7739 [Sanghuangporus baumii]|uniref:Uncharacterized protein n=1 Tax=Sanghuangporus baumii TaxID=108892 RepID=A0A9Q5N970_SANBA|nr:hypothetical protein A7U60_g7739 [Sanghuangporus baumii]
MKLFIKILAVGTLASFASASPVQERQTGGLDILCLTDILNLLDNGVAVFSPTCTNGTCDPTLLEGILDGITDDIAGLGLCSD